MVLDYRVLIIFHPSTGLPNSTKSNVAKLQMQETYHQVLSLGAFQE